MTHCAKYSILCMLAIFWTLSIFSCKGIKAICRVGTRFFGGASRGKMRFWRGKNPKKLPKMADFCHFFPSNWGASGEEPPTGGEYPLMPPTLDASTPYESVETITALKVRWYTATGYGKSKHTLNSKHSVDHICDFDSIYKYLIEICFWKL